MLKRYLWVLTLITGMIGGYYLCVMLSIPPVVEDARQQLHDKHNAYFQVVPAKTAADTMQIQVGDYEYKIPKKLLAGMEREDCHNSGMLIEFDALSMDQLEKGGMVEMKQANLMKVTMHSTLFHTRARGRTDIEVSDMLKNRYITRTNSASQAYKYQELSGTFYDLNVQIPDLGSKNENVKTNSMRMLLTSRSKEGELETFIDCNMPGNGKASRCQQYFIVNDAVVSLSYRLPYIQHWKRLQQLMTDQVTYWTVGKIQEEKPSCQENNWGKKTAEE